MAIRKRGCIIRSTAIFAVAIAGLICVTSRNALATSDGCKAWNKMGLVKVKAYSEIVTNELSGRWTVGEHISISGPDVQSGSLFESIYRNYWNYRMTTNGGKVEYTLISWDIAATFGFALINYTNNAIPFTFSCDHP